MSLVRKTTLGISILGLVSFVTAFLWEHVGHATPCIMCYLERWCFLIAGVLGICALQSKKDLIAARMLGVIGFVFAAASVILFRHMGTQYKWFKAPGMCKGKGPVSESDFANQLLNPISQVSCDRIEFTVFGQPPTFFLLGLTLTLVAICAFGFLMSESASPNTGRRSALKRNASGKTKNASHLIF